MKTPKHRLNSGYRLAAALGLVCATFTAAPGMAQTVSNPIQDLQTGGNSSGDLGNILNGSNGTGAGSIMNLMNRLQSIDGRSVEEISADQRENINSAAEAFRQRQQQRLEAQPSAPSAVPAPIR
jgi:hypothetical protein